MKYYKIKENENIIGVINSDNFRILQPRHNFLMISNEEKGQFVEYQDKLYRDTWMTPPTNNSGNYQLAEIVEISEEDYEEYMELISQGEENIPEFVDNNVPVIIEEINTNAYDVAAAKQIKLAALSSACHQAIENGFDIEDEHYSLSAYDQLNIATLSSLIANGKTEVLYHADGKPVEYYSAQRFKLLAEIAAHHISYHTTYYNTLKAYVNSLENEKDILAIQYGDEIPEEYQTAILKNL